MENKKNSFQRPKNLFAISFDGVAVSGVTTEFLKVARIFYQQGFKIFLDLGYDIKADKNNFFRPYTWERDFFPFWVNLARFEELSEIKGYSSKIVEFILENFVRKGQREDKIEKKIEQLSNKIAQVVLAHWEDKKISLVLVENGTLPENLIFTKALHKAINIYGRRHQLGKFVFWRDHDLMWSSEPGKYGRFPYPGVPKIKPSPFIHYVVINNLLKRGVLRWSSQAKIMVFPNCYTFSPAKISQADIGFKKDFSIPQNALIIARCTRIISQKRIDREIYLISQLNKRFQSLNLAKKVYLVIAGRIDEHPQEYTYLKRLAYQLGVEKEVVFCNGLLPYESFCRPRKVGKIKYSIKDLLAYAQISSFLTSYDYEGFGNPPGEAIASLRPFLVSSYQCYPEVWGKRKIWGIVLPISKESEKKRDFHLPEEFIFRVFNLLIHPQKYQRKIKENFHNGKKYFSLAQMKRRVKDLFPHHFRCKA